MQSAPDDGKQVFYYLGQFSMDNPDFLLRNPDFLLKNVDFIIKLQVIRLIGILGAVDPHRHAKLTAIEEANTKEEEVILSSISKARTPMNSSSTLGPSSADYFPTIAIAGLMKILRDPSLSQYSNMVVQAVMQIFKSLSLKCVPFLKDIVPPMLNVMQTCESGLRDFLFQQLGELVRIVKQQ